eukprot:scaffold9520_cov45-Attheya_sp.AAC.1
MPAMHNINFKCWPNKDESHHEILLWKVPPFRLLSRVKQIPMLLFYILSRPFLISPGGDYEEGIAAPSACHAWQCFDEFEFAYLHSLMTEVCSTQLTITLSLSEATRCPHTIMDANKLALALVMGFGKAKPACLTGRAMKSHNNGHLILVCPRRAGRKSSFNDDCWTTTNSAPIPSVILCKKCHSCWSDLFCSPAYTNCGYLLHTLFARLLTAAVHHAAVWCRLSNETTKVLAVVSGNAEAKVAECKLHRLEIHFSYHEDALARLGKIFARWTYYFLQLMDSKISND